jgi:aryl-alcohol dehydrogenase-like predicted oxidoreductase
MGEGPNERGLSAKHVREACDASLKRLKTDYVDCYMCHHPDPDVPAEETIRAMADLHRAGKILYWGVSNWPAPMIVKTNAIAREIGAPLLALNEPRYNLIWRWPENDIFPATADEGIGNVTFSPLGHGMLAGIYKPGEEAPAGSRAADAASNEVTRKLYYNEERKQQAQELVRLAEGLGVTAAELAIAWCLRHPQVSSVIVGAWSVAELESDLRAEALVIPDEYMERLDALYPASAGPPGA